MKIMIKKNYKKIRNVLIASVLLLSSSLTHAQSNLLFPPNNLSLEVSGSESTEVPVTWSTSGQSNASYLWVLKTVLTLDTVITVSAGTDTVLPLDFATIDQVLQGAGLNVGDTVDLVWYVVSNDGITSLNSLDTFNLQLIRGTVLSDFDLLFPPDGLSLLVEGAESSSIDVTWNSSNLGSTYEWNLFLASNPSVNVVSLPSNNSGSDTILTLTLGAIDGLLADAGLNIGDSIALAWNVTATSNGISIDATSNHSLNLTRGVVLYNFDLLSPADSAFLMLEGNNNATVDITWESAGEGVNYIWELDALFGGTFNPAIVSVPSNVFGSDTTLTLDLATIESLLNQNGINIGDTAFLQWRVKASNGIDSLYSNNVNALYVERGIILNDFSLLSPPNQFSATIEGSGTNEIDITWTSSAANATYEWLLDASGNNFSNPLISVLSNNNGADTILTLDFATVDALLADAGLNQGDTVDLIWTVRAFAANDSIEALQTFDLQLIRGGVLNSFDLLSPPSGTAATIVGNPNNEVAISWSSSNATATYKWYLDLAGNNFSNPIAVIESANNGLDTNLTLDFASIDGVLAGAGLNIGDSVDLIWNVRAFDGGDYLWAMNNFDLQLTRGSVLSNFNLLSPPSGTAATISGPENQTVSISWNSAGANVNYVWYLDAAGNNFSNPIVSVPAANSGSDTTLVLDFATIDAVLNGAGVSVGSTANLIWTVRAFDGSDSLQAIDIFTLDLTRGNITPIFDLISPPDNTSLLVQGNGSTPVNITWENIPNYTYDWVLALRGSNLQALVLSPIESNNSGNANELTLDFATIDAVLGGANLLGATFNIGDTANLEWAVRATNGIDTIFSSSVFNIDLVRGIVPNDFSLIGPADGFTAAVEGDADTELTINWTSSFPGAAYDWVLRTSGANPLELSRISAGTDTFLIVDFAAIDNLLNGAGLVIGDFANLEWTVETSLDAQIYEAENAPFALNLTRGVLFTDFELLSPPNNTRLLTSQDRSIPINITWENAQFNGNSDVFYTWQLALAGTGFATILAEIDANSSGFDNSLDITMGDVLDVLDANGIAEGDSVETEWRVIAGNALNPGLTKFSNEFNLRIVRDFSISTQEILSSKPSFNIYPNPASSWFNIEVIHANNQAYSIEVFDLSGRSVYGESGINSTNHTINFSTAGNLPQGMYVINIRLGDTNLHKTLVVK